MGAMDTASAAERLLDEIQRLAEDPAV
jgi:hypothetical protein